MKNEKFLSVLKDLGLSENEAKVYLATLSLGQSTILKIARASEIKRTTVYSVIKSLLTQGLMRIEVRGFKKKFVAESPEKLESIVDARREKLKHTLPEFLALYNVKGGESFIKYYEGLEAVKSLYENLLRDIRPHENYMVVTDQKRWLALDPEYFLRFTERRAKLPIDIRLLMQDSGTARDHKEKEKNFNEHIKLLPKGTSLTTNLVVTPRRVIIHQLVPPILAIVIENQSVIQMQQELFEIIWRSMPD